MRRDHPILLIEDDQVDAMTVRRALRDIGCAQRLEVVSNGEEALAHLRAPMVDRPCLILLDLNMPRMNGIEFLKIAKSDPALRRIPVVVLTSSAEKRDRLDAFNNGVAGYVVKPLEYAEFVDAMRSVRAYWTLSKLSPD